MKEFGIAKNRRKSIYAKSIILAINISVILENIFPRYNRSLVQNENFMLAISKC